ncbi:MAG: arylsulfotransferase [Dehalococcoidia bacterium DG_22]|nr:MAG: arylsulfotransferase [Dehalococcoidia bacterium DG_22]
MATSVDQQTQRRRGVGLIAHDPERAFQGYTLFTPQSRGGPPLLIDMEGKIVHEWRTPLPAHSAYLLPNGSLLALCRTPGSARGVRVWQLVRAGAVMEIDWDGKVLWEVRDPDHHHDARLTRNGNVLMLCIEEVPPDLAAKVRGGLPGTEIGGVMCSDKVVEMTKEGAVVWEWHAWQHLDPEVDCITPQDWREEWTHANTVEELPKGDILVSFRNISTIAIIERRTGKIRWRLGPEVLAQQHHPNLLPNGTILLFDNGTHRVDNPFAFSRVLEIDPATKRIVWSYQDQPAFNFHSPYESSAQRLPNGNTFICEGVFGRLFEVTPEGQVVWEYINPHFGEAPLLGENNWLFRAFRYSRDDIEQASGGRISPHKAR